MFDPVDPRQSFPELERGILAYWREEDIFRRSIEMREGREEFSFYDGPPFATGLPHYGHLLAGTIKDVIPRYQTMRGKMVQRRFGWDCHGLPIENLIEKENDIKSKQDIEAMGIKRFNDLCRMSVQRYAKEWRTTVERTGRWVDMDHDYRTMDVSFMESIWWVFKSLHEKGLIYEGYKPMHVCPRCVTPLSNFEVTQGYKDVTDLSATVMFELTDEPGTYLLAWTTTPWTLPGNLFVAVGADISYVKVKNDGKTYIVAQENVEKVFKDREHAIDGKAFKGKKLEGKTFTPLFPYFADAYAKKAFKVVSGSFVTTDEGTGLVHIAPGFGEDDFAIGEREEVTLLQHVTMEGQFIPAVTDFSGMDVKPIDDPAKTDRKIAEYLEKHGKLFAKESYRHSYPHCWRCDSPLLNYATASWFVKVEKVKEDMLSANAKTEWVPAHLRDGRFGNWLENARDWAISRNRYWGTPLPVWRSDKDGELDVIGSADDIKDRMKIRFTKVTAVRHGEAEHNVGRYFQSTIPGVDLTERGKKQADEAGKFLSAQKVDVIYTSPLNRTMQTAQAIAEKTGAQVIVDERLREIDVGEYEGKSFDRSDLALVKLRRQKKLQENSPENLYHMEGMEKWTDTHKRITDFFNDILPKHRSHHVVVVTHADPMNAIRHYFTREDPFKISHWPYPKQATPESYMWDHDTSAQLDLHKEFSDEMTWSGAEDKRSTEAVCVRHGETDWNKESKVQGGNADIPLNDTGRKQAQEQAKKLKKEKFDAIICSDLSRAKETAEIIAKELGLKVDDEMDLLRERNAGDWSGRNAKEMFEQNPILRESTNMSFHFATPSNGESLSQFITRIQKAHEAIQKKYAGKRVLIVAHRGVVQALQTIAQNLTYDEGLKVGLKNGESVTLSLNPFMKRIPQVLDCWFESGSMPYAQQNFPFKFNGSILDKKKSMPPGFPADFIAEGIDQTRGWFYTLTVLAASLYKEPAFKHCVVNGIVLAEDGRKMSKRLKNYPEPTEVIEKRGADALRFALMNSPAVRGEDLRFSEKMTEDALRNVLLPLWNSFSFFVTYANLANFTPVAKPKSSAHPLDRWIRAEVKDLGNRMTKQMDGYDLSATCDELFDTIDALTNWYIRLSRRRFAGKGMNEMMEAEPENFEQDRHDALTTLYDVLLEICQLLAPFCPFITEYIYLNLVSEEHGSIHLTDWPEPRKLTKEEDQLIAENRLLRQIVSLGLKVRSNRTIKIRTPLASATVSFPANLLKKGFSEEQLAMLRRELNVKRIDIADDPGKLGERYVQVDAKKVGPRLGKRVQDVIQAGKRGEFQELSDGRIEILEEKLGPDEAAILYRAAEGQDIEALRGIVVSMDTNVTEELQLEGLARDLIRAIQKLRKDLGYELGEKVTIGLKGNIDHLLNAHKALIEQETSTMIGESDGQATEIDLSDLTVTVHMNPKA